MYDFDLTAFDDFVKTEGDHMEFLLEFGDQSWNMHLHARDLRSADYSRQALTEDGLKVLPPSENITFKGHLTTPDESLVALTVDEELLYGFVEAGGETFFIEPLWYFDQDQSKNLVVVYNQADVIWDDSQKCGAEEMLKYQAPNMHDDHDHNHSSGEGMEKLACKEV